MLQKPIPLVLISKAGDALFFQGPENPALFVPAYTPRRGAVARDQFIAITGPLCLAVLAVMFAAKAQFSVIRHTGDDAMPRSGIFLLFDLPNGLKVVVVDNDLVVAQHHQLFAKKGYKLLVGPNLCQTLV